MTSVYPAIYHCCFPSLASFVSLLLLFIRSDTTLPSEGKLCTMRLNPSQAETLSHAIGEHYWYQMYIDELPVRGMVGEHVHVPGEKEKSFVYTHKEFSIAINGDRIVEVCSIYTLSPLLCLVIPILCTIVT